MHTSRISRLALLTVVAGVLLAGSIPAAASASAQRYASPTGSGPEPCTSASPCAIKQAVEAANTGDEVIVAPGDYPLTGLNPNSGITVHGVRGKPRPRLLFKNAQTPAIVVYASTLRYVEVVRAPGEQGVALGAQDAQLDQVIVRGSAQEDWPAVMNTNSVIRNSIIVSPANYGAAIFTHAANATATGTFRNVTAIATGNGGVAIRARATSPGAFANVLARNVIARGGPGAADLRAETDNIATAKITVDDSNWLDGDTWEANASIVDGGGNQSSAPAFVDAASGDYRQAAGSPTIDAGLGEFIDGPLDVDGDSRQLGNSIDIGADEFVVAPAVTTGPAGAVTGNSATLTGSVDSKGAPTSYHFEYGPSTAYGSTTPTADAGSGGAVTATANIAGLSPATTYHYRLVASNAGGSTKGADQTFTTAAAAATPSTATSPTPAPATAAPTQGFAGVGLVSARLSFARGFVMLRLACPAGTVGRCSGRTKLTARRRTASGAVRAVTLGRAPFSIAAGEQAKVKVRVSRAGRRLLGRVRRLRAKDTNAARDGAGQSRKTAAAVTIRRRHR